MRVARNSAFDGAIEACQDIAARGGSAHACAEAIRTMKDQVDRFEHLTQDYRQMIKELESLRDKANLTKTLRQDILKLFTEAKFTRGTQFAATGLRRSEMTSSQGDSLTTW